MVHLINLIISFTQLTKPKTKRLNSVNPLNKRTDSHLWTQWKSKSMTIRKEITVQSFIVVLSPTKLAL